MRTSPDFATEQVPAAPKKTPAAALSWDSIPQDSLLGRTAAFGLILFQCAILYWVVRRFSIETELFRIIVAVALGGFAIHHLLPLRFRLPFFVALSMGMVVYCLGLESARWRPEIGIQRAGTLFVIGFVLILICRLPLRFSLRVGLLTLAGTALAVFRAGWLSFGPLDAIWPVLGGMFMYRIACYMYDREHERKPSSFLQACAYFFLFPNVWLFVFPLIDYKTFIATYFSGNTLEMYQRGLKWMMRGILQILLWRFIYQEAYIDPARISDGSQLIQFLLANMALYLRVSGQFHFAIGLLHLFGFNLPETNRRYFLAANFVDYWRRANIYMKDFLMKISYYPLVVRFKKLGPLGSVAAAIGGTFVITWLLHPYQWFWLRGQFPMNPKDAVFWGLLGAGVMYSSVKEMRKSKTSVRNLSPWTASLRTASSTAGTFTLMTLLWSIWTCADLSQWAGLWRFADATTIGYGLLAAGVIAAAYLLIESPVRPWGVPRKEVPKAAPASAGFAWRGAVFACIAPAVLLIAGSTDRVLATLHPDQLDIVRSLFSNEPNRAGQESMVRGYYEGLMDADQVSPLLADAMNVAPPNWVVPEETTVVRITNNLRTRELLPSQNTVINGVPFRTNRWGQRDQEYSLDKPPGIVRFAFLGSSITMGWNAPQEGVFEALFEASLNAEAGAKKYESLNFGVHGNSVVSLVEQIDADVLRFDPDVMVVVSHPEDPMRVSSLLAKAISMGVEPQYPYLKEVMGKAGVTTQDKRPKITRNLAPYEMELVRWAYDTIAAACRARGIQPWLVYLSGPLKREPDALDQELVRYAEAAGFKVIPLFDAFAAVQDRSTLVVAPWDLHPNATGHRLIAENLLRKVRGMGLLKELGKP